MRATELRKVKDSRQLIVTFNVRSSAMAKNILCTDRTRTWKTVDYFVKEMPFTSAWELIEYYQLLVQKPVYVLFALKSS